jgi:hypothetical protein
MSHYALSLPFEDSRVRQLWWLTATLTKQGGAQKDVKNEGCSQWFIENKGAKKVLPMSC